MSIIKNFLQHVLPTRNPNYGSQSEQAEVPTIELLRCALQRLNCEFQEESNDTCTRLLFDYQSGHFAIRCPNTNGIGFDVHYPGILDTGLDDIDLVRSTCNEVNCNSSYTTTALYTIDDDDHKIYVHIISKLASTTDLAELTKNLQIVFSDCFQSAQTFGQRYRLSSGHPNYESVHDPEFDYYRTQHEKSIIAESEVNHDDARIFTPGHVATPTQEELQIGNVCKKLALLPGCTFTRLRQVTDADMTILAQGDGPVREFNLCDAFQPLQISHADVDVNDEVFLQADFNRPLSKEPESSIPGTLYLHLVVTHCTDDCIYLKLTYLAPAKESLQTNQESLSVARAMPATGNFTFAYDLRSEQQAEAEFKYMWNEAHDNISPEEEKEMSPDMKWLRQLLIPEEGRSIYWGWRYMHEGRYYEAYINLQRAWHAQSHRYDDMTKAEKSFFMRISFWVGMCLYELKQYKMAAYYFSATEYSDLDSEFTSGLINCYIAAGDFRASSIVDKTMEILESNIKQYTENGTAVPDEAIDFQNFLRRRQVFLLVEKEHYDEAEQICTSMLKEPRNADFAINELSFISHLRDKRNSPENDKHKP